METTHDTKAEQKDEYTKRPQASTNCPRCGSRNICVYNVTEDGTECCQCYDCTNFWNS